MLATPAREEPPLRRSIYRNAFILIAIALVFGGVCGAVPDPSLRRLWLAAHIVTMMFALLMIAVGVVLPKLRLGTRGLKVLYVTTVPMSYFGVAMLSVFANLAKYSMPILTPEMPQVQGWPFGVVVASTALQATANFIQVGLVIFGLRGEDPAKG